LSAKWAKRERNESKYRNNESVCAADFDYHPPSERRGVGVCTGPVSGKQKKNRLQFLCGALQAWLGHKNIQHTVRYAELAPDRFKDFWQ
jgi:hypothetical protein